MRIGLFSDAYLPDINGVVSSIATLKAALEKLGHTVFVVSNHNGINVKYDAENHILRLPGLEVKKFYGYNVKSDSTTGRRIYPQDGSGCHSCPYRNGNWSLCTTNGQKI